MNTKKLARLRRQVSLQVAELSKDAQNAQKLCECYVKASRQHLGRIQELSALIRAIGAMPPQEGYCPLSSPLPHETPQLDAPVQLAGQECALPHPKSRKRHKAGLRNRQK